VISTGRLAFNDVEDDPTQLKLGLNNDRDYVLLRVLQHWWILAFVCFSFLYPEINIRFHAFLLRGRAASARPVAEFSTTPEHQEAKRRPL